MGLSEELRGGRSSRVAVLLAAEASSWEQAALESVSAAPGLVLVKRCLDLTDLLASATTGTAQVAVVSGQLAGLDADSIANLARHEVRVVAVVEGGHPARGSADEEVGERTRLLRMGVTRVVEAGSIASLPGHISDAGSTEFDLTHQVPARPSTDLLGERLLDQEADGAPERNGRILAVWGPTGAPGRTTVAIALAAEAAARGLSVTLIDADPYGGAAAQHLAVLEDVSGLLATTRLANTGQLDRVRLARLAREVAPRLRLVSGLPRPDRWTEVRAQAFSDLLATARALDDLVVVDTGFGLPVTAADPFTTAPSRDDSTATALAQADHVLVVGSADPVGLTRLARSIRELGDVRPDGPSHVVVNRMRPTLGWSAAEVVDLVARVAPTAGVSMLPEDRAGADRALVSGRTLLESGDSTLRRAVAVLADTVLAETVHSETVLAGPGPADCLTPAAAVRRPAARARRGRGLLGALRASTGG